MLLCVRPVTLHAQNTVANQADWLAYQEKQKEVAILEVFSKEFLIN